MRVYIVPITNGAPVGQLAEAELCFDDGPLSGLKLVGFTVWEGRNGRGRNVTLPARQYSVNGERRHYALLRAAEETATTQPPRDRILRAYADHEDSVSAGGVVS